MKILTLILSINILILPSYAQETKTITMANVFGETPEGRMPTHTAHSRIIF